VPFVILVNVSAACAGLAADKVKVGDSVVAEFGLEVGTPASLEGVSGVWFEEAAVRTLTMEAPNGMTLTVLWAMTSLLRVRRPRARVVNLTMVM
jgi:hypothetical protein